MKRCRSSNPTPTNRPLQPGYVDMQEVLASVSFPRLGHTPLKIIDNHSAISKLIIPVQYIVCCWFYVRSSHATGLEFWPHYYHKPFLMSTRTAYRIRRDIPAHRAATAFLVDPGLRLSQPSPVRCPENPGISERSQDPNNVEQPLWANRWYGDSETLCLSEVALLLARPPTWDRIPELVLDKKGRWSLGVEIPTRREPIPWVLHWSLIQISVVFRWPEDWSIMNCSFPAPKHHSICNV